MRQLPAVVTVVAAGIAVAACGGGHGGGTSSTTTTTTSKPPIAQAALPNLLLTPAEVDSVLGVTGSKTDKSFDTLQEDKSTDVFPKGYKFPAECLFITGEALTPLYSGSGNTAVHGERDLAPIPSGSSDPNPDVSQFVVLFPSAQQASAFFDASTQKWPACANRQETVPGGDADAPDIQWKVGPVANANGVLSTTVNVTLGKGGDTMSQSCQRALTVRNNVVIDTEACRKDPGDAGINVAKQIAGKVDKQ
ncbi:sensor domain-containing protein [Mycobacterium montefiorense]|uniref:Sensor domain-containing protein n=1 Tax=Mycobacterium montefiorense TaxID=154654 RepID=A0AA37PI49_9MYCO|nr:sensor domain-containing protein [Mycobacterium montefiorense]MCV7425169.1 sensor domain-containing protein [Mycobacterium montefiorense]GBG37396.1 sensor domain-containing protein [Mycobacterium montefiorense]GKU36657.1 sensor domain-containing protein [Mycobacterium montefiorense]GKU42158.1 sensor domain-containing protein [Mycobacterium montefiorense]GKU45915.1 sensor domain-containing protein [Mycobacterium montefiorense]